MANRFYYLLTFLPPIPSLGEIATVGFDEVHEQISKEGTNEAKLLLEGITLEESIKTAANERPVFAAKGNFESKSPQDFSMPDFPSSISEVLNLNSCADSAETWIESLWKAYYEHLRKVGKIIQSTLLVRWVDFETGLRSALEIARTSLQTQVVPFSPGEELTEVVKGWQRISDPMQGERFLDENRWRFIESESDRYSFDLNELTGYLLKLRLLLRYARFDKNLGRKILKEVSSL
ncbi:DUF2764 family protein [bacterium]|nr:DUF2764 family protein [bacterium]